MILVILSILVLIFLNITYVVFAYSDNRWYSLFGVLLFWAGVLVYFTGWVGYLLVLGISTFSYYCFMAPALDRVSKRGHDILYNIALGLLILNVSSVLIYLDHIGLIR